MLHHWYTASLCNIDSQLTFVYISIVITLTLQRFLYLSKCLLPLFTNFTTVLVRLWSYSFLIFMLLFYCQLNNLYKVLLICYNFYKNRRFSFKNTNSVCFINKTKIGIVSEIAHLITCSYSCREHKSHSDFLCFIYIYLETTVMSHINFFFLFLMSKQRT